MGTLRISWHLKNKKNGNEPFYVGGDIAGIIRIPILETLQLKHF